jgi:cob(I)alamin adenosyltransferase
VNKTLKGTAIWILALFSVLSGANVVNAIIMWFNLGPESTFTPYLVGDITGAIPVYVYILISIMVTAVFLGATSHKIVTELSYADQIDAINKQVNGLEAGLQSQQEVLEAVQAKMFFVDESLEHNKQEFSRRLVEQGHKLTQTFERGRKAQQKIMNGVQDQVFHLDKRLDNFKKGLEKQREATKEVIGDFLVGLGPQLGIIKETVEKQHGELENALEQIDQKEKTTKAAITEQKNELAEIRSKLEKLECRLARPEPLLGSQSSVMEIKGIGHGKGAELKEIGITNVGEFIMADSEIVAERMGSSKKTVEKLQGQAQLLMVPGVKEKHLSLLEAVDVNDRSGLSAQEPIELSKRMNAVFEANIAKGKISPVDKPTIEEIDSWIKFSKH